MEKERNDCGQKAFHLVFVVTSSNFGLKGSAREQGERINIIEVILVQWEKAMEVE